MSESSTRFLKRSLSSKLEKAKKKGPKCVECNRDIFVFPSKTFSAVPLVGAPSSTDPANATRFRIIREIKDTERTFLTFLQSVVLLFYNPCKNSLQTNPILQPELMDDLFGNIVEVAEVSYQILQALELFTKLENWYEYSIGSLFLEITQVCEQKK